MCFLHYEDKSTCSQRVCAQMKHPHLYINSFVQSNMLSLNKLHADLIMMKSTGTPQAFSATSLQNHLRSRHVGFWNKKSEANNEPGHDQCTTHFDGQLRGSHGPSHLDLDVQNGHLPVHLDRRRYVNGGRSGYAQGLSGCPRARRRPHSWIAR